MAKAQCHLCEIPFKFENTDNSIIYCTDCANDIDLVNGDDEILAQLISKSKALEKEVPLSEYGITHIIVSDYNFDLEWITKAIDDTEKVLAYLKEIQLIVKKHGDR